MALDDWRQRLFACGDQQLANALVSSIEALFQANLHALAVDAAERNIAHRVAVHLGNRSCWLRTACPGTWTWNTTDAASR